MSNPFTRDLHAETMQLALYGGFQKRAFGEVAGGVWRLFSGEPTKLDLFADKYGIERPDWLTQIGVARGKNEYGDKWLGSQGLSRPAHYNINELGDPEVQAQLKTLAGNQHGNNIGRYVDNKFRNLSFWKRLRLMFSTVFGRIANWMGIKNHPFKAEQNFKREAAREYLKFQKYDAADIDALPSSQLDEILANPSKFEELTDSVPGMKARNFQLMSATSQLLSQASEEVLRDHFGGDLEKMREARMQDPDQLNQLISQKMEDPVFRKKQPGAMLEHGMQYIDRDEKEPGVPGTPGLAYSQIKDTIPQFNPGPTQTWAAQQKYRPQFSHQKDQGVNLWTEEAHPKINRSWNKAYDSAIVDLHEQGRFVDDAKKNNQLVFDAARERFDIPAGPLRRGFESSLARGSNLQLEKPKAPPSAGILSPVAPPAAPTN